MPAVSPAAFVASAYFRPLPADFAAAQRVSAAFFAASLRFFALTPFHRDFPAFAC